MWERTVRALLEPRLAERWTPLLVAQGAAILMAAVLISVGMASEDRPSSPVLVASLFALAAVWYDARRTEMADRAEKREALHAALPTTRISQALARALEPAVPLAATVLVVSLAYYAIGRGAVATAGPWQDDLLLFLGVASWLLVLEAVQLTAYEVQFHLRRVGLGWMFWIGIVLSFGLPGAIFGYLLGDGTMVPFIFYLALGRPGSIALALVLALLFGWLSVLLYRDRDAMLGTC